MTEQDVLQEIADTLGVPADTISMETNAADIAEWDSMGALGIVTLLSRHGIHLPPGETDQLSSTRSIVVVFRNAGKLG